MTRLLQLASAETAATAITEPSGRPSLKRTVLTDLTATLKGSEVAESPGNQGEAKLGTC